MSSFALDDLIISQSKKIADNYYIHLIKKYNKNLKKSKHNSLLNYLVEDDLIKIENLRKIKIKQVKTLYDIINHLSIVKLDVNESEGRNIEKEIKSIKTLIKKIEKVIKRLTLQDKK